MEFDPDRVRDNIRRADTPDLLDRVTVYRADLEPEALPLIMQELRSRGVRPEDIVTHEAALPPALAHPGGGVRHCSFCSGPAVATRQGWFRLFHLIPFWPRTLYLCPGHRGPEDPPVA